MNSSYGYQSNSAEQNNYAFSKPKFEFYPYSQHDISANKEYQQHQHHLHYLRHYPTVLTEGNPNYYEKPEHHEIFEQPSKSNHRTRMKLKKRNMVIKPFTMTIMNMIIIRHIWVIIGMMLPKIHHLLLY